MNNTRISKLALSALTGGLLALASTSCTGDFAQVNTNPLLPNDQMLGQDGVLNGVFLPTLQFAPIPTGTSGTGFVNNYQVAYNLTVDSWMGYLAPTDAKWTGRNLTQFFFAEGWTNGMFSVGVTDIFSPWIKIKQLNKDVANPNLEIWHIAQISKIMGMHRTTDRYGAIPYFKVGNGSFTVAYDSQEEVYKSFFAELEEAVNHLYSYSQGNPIVPKASDVVYEGNALRWAKLGNSLMLRLAMRVRYVAPELSRQWAEKALSHSAGLIEAVADEARIDSKAGLRTRHALFTIAGAYNDTRMGASIQSYLKGYNDPRLSVYFEGDTNTAIPPAIPASAAIYASAAKPKVAEFAPTYWMKASEVAFLKAEAALYGYANAGDAATNYRRGVELSFEENGISTSQAATYLSGASSPASFTDVQGRYSSTAPTTATVAWNESASEEQKLEKIITQKYLAIFPDGLEAWSEWRRTGYPRLIPANTNISNMGVVTSDGHKDGVRCIPYPQKEFAENSANVQEAVRKYRGGNNSANVNVWWDAKPKN